MGRELTHAPTGQFAGSPGVSGYGQGKSVAMTRPTNVPDSVSEKGISMSARSHSDAVSRKPTRMA